MSQPVGRRAGPAALLRAGALRRPGHNPIWTLPYTRQVGALTSAAAHVEWRAGPRTSLRLGGRVGLRFRPELRAFRLVGALEFGGSERVSRHSAAGFTTCLGAEVRAGAGPGGARRARPLRAPGSAPPARKAPCMRPRPQLAELKQPRRTVGGRRRAFQRLSSCVITRMQTGAAATSAGLAAGAACIAQPRWSLPGAGLCRAARLSQRVQAVRPTPILKKA